MAYTSNAHQLWVFHGGDFSLEVAEQIRRESVGHGYEVTLAALDGFERFVTAEPAVCSTAILIVTTLEDEQPDPQSAACMRFLRRKCHGRALLAGVRFAVLGLGDSNNLAQSWRRVDWATPPDVNQAGQNMDAWLDHLGGTRFHARGDADDRTDNVQVAPWIAGMWRALGPVPPPDRYRSAVAAEAPAQSQADFSCAPAGAPRAPGAGNEAPSAGLPESVRRAIHGEMSAEEKALAYQQSLSSWRGSEGYIHR
jgi:sulfite reductase alpha subunit-like flavoprotein